MIVKENLNAFGNLRVIHGKLMVNNFNKLIKQITAYGFVGLVGTLAHYAVLMSTVEFQLLPAPLATSFGFLAGALINHTLNHIFVFKSKHKLRSTAINFYSVALVGFFLNLSVFYVFIELSGMHYLFSQVIATGTVFISTFLVNRIWTFA